MQAVLAEYEGPLVRYATRITGDVERGRDVAQETFLRLWRSGPQGEDKRLGQWLFTVCRNRAVDVLRKESRMGRLSDAAAAAAASSEPSPAEMAERRDLAEVAADMLDALPANQREVIRLKLDAGFSYREISGITGLSVSNVGFLIHTGLKRIRERLGAMGLVGGGG
jgi:RNA polymerase sigma factor (sigma-70 family)